tara:strand:+ start:417 stop:761 length:345 start_codon:yes stop_codon:yes gene_type:complete
VVIELSKEKELMSEDYLRAVGAWSKWILNRMFPGGDIGVRLKEEEQESAEGGFVIRGKYRDVKAYAQALGRERDYIVAAAEYGDEHPITVKAKAELDQASNKFERLTGVKWPFK